MNAHENDCECPRCCREAKAELHTLLAERDAMLDALAIRVRRDVSGWISGGQTTTWIWNDEHERAVELLHALGREPIGGANPRERQYLNPADTRDVPEGI